MSIVEEFLASYVTSDELKQFQSPKATGVESKGRTLVVDFPLCDIDTFFSKMTCYLTHYGYHDFKLMVCSGGSSIYTALLAAGFSPSEIIERRANDSFDVIELIEGKSKLPTRLHRRAHGAQHKGDRLRDKLNELIGEKLGMDGLITFEQFASKRGVGFVVPAYDKTVGRISWLSNETCPKMPIADAVLAACAVQPYLMRKEYFDEDDVKHNLYSSSILQTLPLSDAHSIFKARSLDGSFVSKLVAYGYTGPDETNIPLEGDYFDDPDAKRQAAIIPEEWAHKVRLFTVGV